MTYNNKHIHRRTSPSDATDLPNDLHPVLARVMRLRHARTATDLDHSLDRLIPPARLKGIDRAVALLESALGEGQRILIVADFDADGATSCALIIRALRQMGGADVRYIVPNRFEYGYGLTPEIVALAAQQQPNLIITVDNGISSVEGVREARKRGLRVLVTDHHLPGRELPEADAIVNPNQPRDEFPSKHLAGVGVAFYVMLALRARLRALGWFDRHGLGEPNLARLLDLVALGTVADVVTLDSNNRILVAQGLVRMNRGNACAGIQALLQVAGRRQGRLTTSDLGYCVAPRLNAAGRLEDMSLGIECLLVDDLAAALDMAYRLDDLNRERRSIQADMQKQADAAIQTLHWEANALPKGLCLYNADWHQGVIGLVAARVKEQLHRPVIAFAAAGKGELKGSARSVPGLHIRDALDNIAARHPGLLSKFGGHAMAAGLSLAKSSYEEFSQSFDEEVSRWLSEDDLQGRVMSDGELAPEDFHLELAQLLRDAGPWGQGFPEPLFDGYFEVINKRVVGEKHLKLTLRLVGEKKSLEAIAFNAAPAGELPKWAQVHAAYRLDVNEYQGCRSLQLVIEHLEPAS